MKTYRIWYFARKMGAIGIWGRKYAGEFRARSQGDALSLARGVLNAKGYETQSPERVVEITEDVASYMRRNAETEVGMEERAIAEADAHDATIRGR